MNAFIHSCLSASSLAINNNLPLSSLGVTNSKQKIFPSMFVSLHSQFLTYKSPKEFSLLLKLWKEKRKEKEERSKGCQHPQLFFFGRLLFFPFLFFSFLFLCFNSSPFQSHSHQTYLEKSSKKAWLLEEQTNELSSFSQSNLFL